MDYKQKYEELIVRLKSITSVQPDVTKQAIEGLFPEIVDGFEDERIRKGLLEYFTGIKGSPLSNVFYGLEVDDIIAWLERQKSTIIPKFRVGDEVIPKNGQEESLTITKVTDTEYYSEDLLVCRIDEQEGWELVEQKHADKVEPKFKAGDKIISTISNIPYYITEVCNGHYLTDVGCIIMFNAQDNFELVEQKPAWGEEDESWFKEMELMCLNFSNNTDYRERFTTFLKSLKDRVQLQNLTVTDKELAQAKKDAYNDALDKIEYHSGEPTFDDGWNAAIWYLKKRNAQPKNTWKPSDEQMEALRVAKAYPSSERREILETLYEDLEQLKAL